MSLCLVRVLVLRLHRIYCLCTQYTWCISDFLCQVCLLELLHSFRKCQQIIIIYRHRNNQFIPYKFTLIRCYCESVSMLSISAYGSFAHVKDQLRSVFAFHHIRLSLLPFLTQKCAHSTTAIKHINTKHFIVWLTSNTDTYTHTLTTICLFVAHIFFIYTFLLHLILKREEFIICLRYGFFFLSLSLSLLSSSSLSSLRAFICWMYVLATVIRCSP